MEHDCAVFTGIQYHFCDNSVGLWCNTIGKIVHTSHNTHTHSRESISHENSFGMENRFSNDATSLTFGFYHHKIAHKQLTSGFSSESLSQRTSSRVRAPAATHMTVIVHISLSLSTFISISSIEHTTISEYALLNLVMHTFWFVFVGFQKTAKREKTKLAGS